MTTSPWIQTYTGTKFEFYSESPEIKIEDIAQALPHLCRFTGQCRVFYSVAQHSVLVAHIVSALYDRLSLEEKAEIRRAGWGSKSDLKLMGLLHDATEAYIGDMNSPLKSRMGDFNAVESRLFRNICKTFN